MGRREGVPWKIKSIQIDSRSKRFGHELKRKEGEFDLESKKSKKFVSRSPNPNPRSRNADGEEDLPVALPCRRNHHHRAGKELNIAVVWLEHLSCRSTSRRLWGRLGQRAPSQGLSTMALSPSGERVRRRKAPRRRHHPLQVAMGGTVSPDLALVTGG
jgi:hypothetical protein